MLLTELEKSLTTGEVDSILRETFLFDTPIALTEQSVKKLLSYTQQCLNEYRQTSNYFNSERSKRYTGLIVAEQYLNKWLLEYDYDPSTRPTSKIKATKGPRRAVAGQRMANRTQTPQPVQPTSAANRNKKSGLKLPAAGTLLTVAGDVAKKSLASPMAQFVKGIKGQAMSSDFKVKLPTAHRNQYGNLAVPTAKPVQSDNIKNYLDRVTDHYFHAYSTPQKIDIEKTLANLYQIGLKNAQSNHVNTVTVNSIRASLHQSKTLRNMDNADLQNIATFLYQYVYLVAAA